MKTSENHRSHKEIIKQYLWFLKDACAAYDKGLVDEAKRIARVILAMLEDGKSPSLFHALGMPRDMLFLSTAGRYLPSRMVPYLAFISMKELDDEGIEFLAACQSEMSTIEKWLHFEDYWNEIIFDDVRVCLSRKELIQMMSGEDENRDYDTSLTKTYETLFSLEDWDWHYLIEEHENLVGRGVPYADVRQIAHELIRSIENWLESPGYTRRYDEREVYAAMIEDRRYFYEARKDAYWDRMIKKDRRVTQTEPRKTCIDRFKQAEGHQERSVLIP